MSGEKEKVFNRVELTGKIRSIFHGDIKINIR